MNQDETTKENHLIFVLNASTVEESFNNLTALSDDEKAVILNAKKDARFGDNLLIAISLLNL
jgi:hypothetical protein